MRLSSNLFVITALVVVLAWAPPASPQGAAPRVVAIGDVHGAYDEFVELLAAAGLVDAAQRWSGGATQLVLLGDVLDRGARSRDALELVMALAEQAPRVGGAVEFVLGNHEVMNLLGDLAYVTPAELAAYSADESATERAAALSRFTAAAGGGDSAALAAEFARRYPPGFFAHRAAFAPGGRFGAWLLERPVVATRGRTAFVHGGLPAAVVGKSAAAINREARDALRDYLDAVAVLRAAGALHVETELREHAAAAARFVAANPEVVARVREAAERVRTLPAALGGDTVFWYRGSVACGAAIEEPRLAAGLAALAVDRLVIGHTPTPGGRILGRFDTRLVRADTGMLRSYYGGRATAVIIDGERVTALDADTATESPIESQPRAVGVTAARGDDELERWLREAPIAAAEPLDRGGLRVRLTTPAGPVTALFRPAVRQSSAELPEVAAYRLDRLLELDLVPVVVRRTVDGRVGSLQLPLDALPTESERVRQQTADAWCPLPEQFNAMYVFDALAGNEARTPAAMRYRPDSWQLVLAGHEDAFGLRGDLPEYLRRVSVALPTALAARLRALTDAELTASLGEVLGPGRRAAILARRDRLLAR